MFQIHPLPSSEFAYLAGMPDAELAALGVQVHISNGSAPCRVSLQDVEPGTRVFLLNYEHQPNASPYRSRHAIYVGDGAREFLPAAGKVPMCLRSRLLSVRAFNARHEIVDADVVEGEVAHLLIECMLEKPEIDYIHLHFAKRGCFAARVTRH